MAGRTLYLIDGHALLYRSFYAIQSLSTSAGFPTNAIFGFLTTLRKLLAEAKPGYLGVVFDAPGAKARTDVYKDYKAHRKPMPDDLQKQIPKLKEVLAAFRIPVLEDEAYEADDVLGSLARKAEKENFRTVIVSTDKDLLQLVGPEVQVLNPAKGLLLDEAKVRELFGASPGQVVDVLALWGDPSDNVPGVPGIGEKTAKSLVAEYGSLDALLENLEKVKNPRVREALKAHRDVLEMSRRLVTIESGLEVDFDPARLAVEEPDTEALVRLFRELEFGALLEAYSPKTAPAEKRYRTITEEADLAALAARIRKAKSVSLDTETDNIFPTRARLVGMSFALEPDEAYYLPLRHDGPGAPAQVPVARAFDLLRPVLEDPNVAKVGQNIKYDAIVLEREGLQLAGVDLDTMVLSYLLEPNWGKHNLDRLGLAYLRETAIPYAEVAGRGKNEVTMNLVPVEKAAPYACQDADFALRLARLLWPRVEAEKLDLLYRDLERPLIAILAEMETAGVRVDEGALRALSAELGRDLARLEKRIHELAGGEFNIHSPQQLAGILFDKLGLRPSKKTRETKRFSTAVEVLEELRGQHPVIEAVVEFRQLSKLKSTYADALASLIDPATGRIHTSYNQTVAATGRLSSSDPNLQNIPARGEMGHRFRRAFIPEKGHGLLCADYSQVELRVLAHLSEDPSLIEIFNKGQDIHAETAARVFGDAAALFPDEHRRRAKIINFSMIYGASAFSLAKELGTSNREAQDFIDRYHARFPRVKAYLDRTVEETKSRGYAETMFGRKRQVPELRQADKATQQAGRRIALNTPIQGSAADIMKKAMIDVRRAMDRRGVAARMILQVHDELVFEVPESERAGMERLVREAMENVCEFRVPLKVSLGWGPSWAEAK
ncbi:MAG: DNA polymerase I [Candidatus Aminicenantes bacterium]|nr:DNA polymerase I [Candidatus Aminicenantes bacterium]